MKINLNEVSLYNENFLKVEVVKHGDYIKLKGKNTSEYQLYMTLALHNVLYELVTLEPGDSFTASNINGFYVKRKDDSVYRVTVSNDAEIVAEWSFNNSFIYYDIKHAESDICYDSWYNKYDEYVMYSRKHNVNIRTGLGNCFSQPLAEDHPLYKTLMKHQYITHDIIGGKWFTWKSSGKNIGKKIFIKLK